MGLIEDATYPLKRWKRRVFVRAIVMRAESFDDRPAGMSQ